MDWVGLDWVGLDWVGLAWVGLAWVGSDSFGSDWLGSVNFKMFDRLKNFTLFGMVWEKQCWRLLWDIVFDFGRC